MACLVRGTLMFWNASYYLRRYRHGENAHIAQRILVDIASEHPGNLKVRAEKLLKEIENGQGRKYSE